MGACRKHPQYTGQRFPRSKSNGVQFCRSCLGMYAAKMAMDSKLVHDCVLAAIKHGLYDTNDEECQAFLKTMYEMENQYARETPVLSV